MKIGFTFALLGSVAAAATAFPAGASAAQPIALSRSSIQQAAQQHPQIVQEFGGSVDARLGAYVAGVGSKIAAQTRVAGAAAAYKVTTLNSPVLNAFAVPGGYVYVTRELLAIMNDEAELASVLGHEMGHVAAKHGQQRSTRTTLGSLGALLVGVLTGSSAATQLAGQVAQTYLLSYSRSQETEADTLGVRYIAAAGYDPFASSRMLASLGTASALDDRIKGGAQRSVPSWAMSHPLSAERVRRTSALARSLRTPASAPRNRDQFLAAIDGMLYDDDPRQGVIEGRDFLHPDLRLRFRVPQGFAMQNGASAVSISGSGGQAQFVAGASAGDLSSYVGRVFQGLAGNQGKVNYPEPSSTTVNGVPAAHSTVRAQTQQGQVDVTVFAYRWSGDRAYHFVTITPAGRGLGPFAEMVRSVTRMSAAEASAIRPRLIDVITVRAGDTVRSLSDRMAYADHKLDRFLALNGLAANSAVTPGQKLKIVVYGQPYRP